MVVAVDRMLLITAVTSEGVEEHRPATTRPGFAGESGRG